MDIAQASATNKILIQPTDESLNPVISINDSDSYIQSNETHKMTLTTKGDTIRDYNDSQSNLFKKVYMDTSSISIKGKKRQIPFYKFLHSTNLTVDAFSYGKIDHCDGYFLTHFHADHYGGLTGKFDHGPLYCSQITCNLIKLQIKVSEKYLVPLPMDTPVHINGVTVTLIDANQ